MRTKLFYATASHNGQEFDLGFIYSPGYQGTHTDPGYPAEVDIDWAASTVTLWDAIVTLSDELASCWSAQCVADLERQCLESRADAIAADRDEAAHDRIDRDWPDLA